MSDEEILNLDLSTLTGSTDSKQESETSENTSEASDTMNTEESSSSETNAETTESDTEEQDEDDSGTSEDGSDSSTNAEDTSTEVSNTSTKGIDANDGSTVNSQSTETNKSDTPANTGDKSEPEKKSDETVDNIYKATHDKIFAPFKANGRDFQVRDVDEAVSLMQMGANYNKKMGALKPHLKVLKMLENNGLLDEAKLNFLIDLDKRNPEAITKLMKDSNIDPMGIDTEKPSTYQPTSYAVHEQELAFDEVVERIKETPSFNRTIAVVAEEWDAESKRIVAQHPLLLEAINDHIERGVYDQIKEEVDRQRMLGKLAGLNDIAAYKAVGDQIHERKGFRTQSATGTSTAPSPVIVTPKQKVDDIELKNKKRAVSSTKPASSSAPAKDFNPLAMSDEEFSKMVKPNFM